MNRSAALAALAGTAALVSARPARGQEALQPVRFSTTPVDSSGEPYYALDSGIAKSLGIDLQLIPSQNGAAITAGVASGSIDVGNSNLVSVILAHAKGIPQIVIAPGGLYSAKTPSTQLFVPKGSSVRSGADLAGKTVAVNTLNGLPQFGTQAWIDKTGGASAGVRFVEMPSGVLLSALQNGQIDAAAVVEPFVSPARAVATAVAAPFDAIAPSFLITAHFTSLAWANAHRALVQRVKEMVAKSAAWANTHHAESGKILVNYAHLSDDTVRTMQRTVFAETLDVAQIQPVIELTAKYGGITSFPAQQLLFQS